MLKEHMSAFKRKALDHKHDVAKAVPGELMHRGASYIIIIEGVMKLVAHKPVLVIVLGGVAFLVYEIVMIVTVEVEG